MHLLEYSIQERHVVSLGLDGVGEEDVGLVSHQLLNGDLLHT